MNSTQLQEKFPEVYKEFFSKNDLVMSGCFSMSWGPRSIGHVFNKLILKSCLPLRCYVGIKKRNDGDIILGDAILYSAGIDNFQSVPISSIIKNSSIFRDRLGEFLRGNQQASGYTISLLSEVGKGHSFGFTGTFPAVLSAVLNFLVKKVSEEDFNDYKNFLLSDKKDSIFKFSWELGLIIRNGLTVGQTAMHTIYGLFTPALYVVKTSLTKINAAEINEIPTNFITFDTITPECNGNFEIPFEFAIIFSGVPSEVTKLEYSKERDIRDTNGLSDFMEERILPHVNIDSLYLHDILIESSPYKLLSDAMGILNFSTIEMFHQNFLSGYNSIFIQRFLKHMNHLGEALSIIEPQSNFARTFLNIFQLEKRNLDEEIGIFPMYSGKLGGGYVVGMKPGISRDTFYKTCSSMKKIYPHLEIDYFSATDGFDSTGIRIEQNTATAKFSVFLPKGQFRFFDIQGTSYIDSYDKILQDNYDKIIFDRTTRKIYFHGMRLTSEDILSQSTTVDIISHLMFNLGMDISSSTLPASSYMKNKNEMMGKIIVPLIRYIEKNTGETLLLTCRGELGSFYLKLSRSSVPIGVLSDL